MFWNDIPSWANDVSNSILQVVKKKDPFTFYHCCRVGRGSRKLAKAMGLNEFEQGVLEFSGLFHDVGKVGVPDDILLKPRRLSTEEMEIMRLHPIKSAEILEPLSHIPFFKSLQPGVCYHHERVDGTGYPFNLVGDQIPLSARIIAVVDSYDAMTNKRPYRDALPKEIAIKELIDYSGSQFDANLVKIFLEALPYFYKDDQEEGDDLVIAHILNAA